MEVALREKPSDTLGGMMFGVTNLNKHTQESAMTLRKMKTRRVDLKVLIKELAEERMIKQIEVGALKILVKKAYSDVESTKEHVSQLTNESVMASVHHFEEVRSLLYPHLDLRPLDPFKVVMDGELVDEE